MRRMFFLAGMLICLLLLSSCAGVGALVTITAFGVEGYEEARAHRPDLKLEPLSNYLPDLKFSSNESPSGKNTKTSSSNTPVDFGFDCSKLGNENKQSKCFDDFSKALAKTQDQSLEPKDVVTPKKKEKITTKLKGNLTHKKEKDKLATLKKVIKAPQKALAKVAKKLSSTTKTLPTSFIQNWASAWEKKNISTYMSFYSKEYKGTQNHRGAWEASRQRALKKNKNISIKLRNIQIHKKGEKRVEVNFTQEYKSDGYADTGIKELLLEKKGTDWRIIKETWMPAGATVKQNKATDRTHEIKDRLATWLSAWENKDVNTYPDDSGRFASGATNWTRRLSST